MLKKVKNITSFTLLELMIVVIVLTILGTISIPLYRYAVRNSLIREAHSIMSLIIQAEKIYRLEEGSYITCSSTSDCNNKLHLEISSNNWDFRVLSSPSWQVRAIYIGAGSDVPNQTRNF